jgi:hydrogenase small subunit
MDHSSQGGVGELSRGRHRAGPGAPIAEHLEDAGVSRRNLLRWSAGIAATLGLPAVPFAARIAEAAATKPRLPVLWLNGQECTGDMESFLRSAKTAPSDLLLGQISLDYSELLMAGAGTAAEQAKEATQRAYGGKYVVIVEGSVPTAQNGVFCTVGGQSFHSIVKTAAAGALGVIAAGTCASHGGIAAAAGGVTGASSVASALGTTSTKVILLPGCPVNGDNLVATLVNYVALGTWPALDSTGRPSFIFAKSVHSQCERRPFYEAGQFVRAWGDAGHQKGWCLRAMGCLGVSTRGNCPTVKWNGGTSWPVGSGGMCVGCATSHVWDWLGNGGED